MEGTNSMEPYYKYNTSHQVSGHACSETKWPWLIPDTDSLCLNNLKPASEATQCFSVCKETLSKCPQFFQHSSSKSVLKCSLSAAVSDEMEATYRCIHTTNLAGPFAEYTTPVTEDVTALLVGHDSEAQNGGLAEKLALAPLFDGFQVQTSETCHKSKTLTFDQSQNSDCFTSKPVLVQKLSGLLSQRTNIKEDDNFKNMDPEMETIAQLPYIGGLQSLDVKFPSYREAASSAVATLPNTRMNKLCLTTLNECRGEFIDCLVAENESVSHVSCNVPSQPNSGDSKYELHENTEDLDALLSSDEEESSTGHSTSAFSRSSQKMHTEVTNSEHLAKKRRIEWQAHIEEEVGFGPATPEESVGESDVNDKCCLHADSPLATTSWESRTKTKYCKSVMDAQSSDKVCTLSALTMLTDSSSKSSTLKCRQSLKLFSRESASAAKSRRHRIKRMVNLLRNIISGENNLDTASLLSETVQYVKYLQEKSKSLEALKGE